MTNADHAGVKISRVPPRYFAQSSRFSGGGGLDHPAGCRIRSGWNHPPASICRSIIDALRPDQRTGQHQRACGPLGLRLQGRRISSPSPPSVGAAEVCPWRGSFPPCVDQQVGALGVLELAGHQVTMSVLSRPGSGGIEFTGMNTALNWATPPGPWFRRLTAWSVLGAEDCSRAGSSRTGFIGATTRGQE